MTDKVTIEGIEDVDITTIDNKLAIQCKYYEGTEYNHSEISEAIKFLLMDFAERKNSGSKKIKYMLYGSSCSIVVHSDIKCTAVTVCKCNNRIFDIFNIFSLEFSCFVFYEHKISSNQF